MSKITKTRDPTSSAILDWFEVGMSSSGDFLFPSNYEEIVLIGAGSSIGKSLACYFISLKKHGFLRCKITIVCRLESQFFYRDFQRYVTVSTLFQPCSETGRLIFYCASPADPDSYLKNRAVTLKLNSCKLFDICENLRESDQLVFLSTSGVYDRELVREAPPPDEDASLSRINFSNVNSIYINAKIIGEYITVFSARENGFKALIIRPSITYTPFIRENDPRLHNIALSAFIAGKKLHMKSSGEDSRNFLFILDFLRALNLLVAVPDRIITANVTNPDDILVRDFVKQIASLNKKGGQLEVIWTMENLISGTKFGRTTVKNKLLDSFDWRPIWNVESAFQYISTLYESANN